MSLFPSALEKATSAVSRIEADIAARRESLDSLTVATSALRDQLADSIAEGDSVDDLEEELAKSLGAAASKAVGLEASQSALAKAKAKLDGLTRAEAVKEARKGLEARQKVILEAEAEFAVILVELMRAAAVHVRACQEEDRLVLRLKRLGEPDIPLATEGFDRLVKRVQTEVTADFHQSSHIKLELELQIVPDSAPSIDELFP